MKILVLGHGGHGKNEVCDILHRHGLSSCSSSWFAFEKVIWPAIGHEYVDKESCYADRRNRRQEWFDFISEYNTPDKARLAKELLAEYDVYNGMRSMDEFLATYKLFDKILWVDRSQNVALDPSMKIPRDGSMELIDNNGSLTSTEGQLVQLLNINQWA
jgi:hypothetical protein